MVRAEAILKYIEIESTKAHLEARSQDLQGLKTKIRALESEQQEKNSEQKNCQEALIEVSSRLKASDYGQKEKELQALKTRLSCWQATAVSGAVS